MVKKPKEPKREHAERERAMAKALSMSILFNKKYYHNIVKILNKKKDMDENEFVDSLRIELAKADLDSAEQDWAINYLKNYDKDLAEASDKKWPVYTETDAAEFHW